LEHDDRESGRSMGVGITLKAVLRQFNSVVSSRLYPFNTGSVLPQKARRVKGLFVAVPQIARNSATPPPRNPINLKPQEAAARPSKRVFGNDQE
jgi:hypothetical protein